MGFSGGRRISGGAADKVRLGSSFLTRSHGEHFVASAAWLLSFLAVFLLAPRQTCPTTSQDGKSRWAPKNLRKGAKDSPEGHPQKCTMTRTWRKAEDAWGWANEGKSNQMRSDPTETGPRNQVPDTHPALRAGTRFLRVNRVIAPTGYRTPRAGPEMGPHNPPRPHPVLGRGRAVRRFLLKKELPTRPRVARARYPRNFHRKQLLLGDTSRPTAWSA